MIRSKATIVRPASIDEAVRHMALADGRILVIGGGSVVLPALSAGLEDPALVLDASRLALNDIRPTVSGVAIGATATYSAVLRDASVRESLPLFASMIAQVTGGPGLWNVATPGGSACYANPASDVPGCLLALHAVFELVSVRGVRNVAASDFFQDAFVTDRRPDELLTSILIPRQARTERSAYVKVKHSVSSWPIATGSCILDADGDRRVGRVVIGAAARIPLLIELPAHRVGDVELLNQLRERSCAMVAEGWSDELATGDYRRSIAGAVASRALRGAWEKAT